MGKLLIIKTGTTLNSVKEIYGDYEDQILYKIGIEASQAKVISVYKNEPPYLPEDISSIIITGSDAMVTEEKAWMKVTAAWLRKISSKEIPILGICFGHQLLAYAFDGRVDYHFKGPEYGQREIRIVGDVSIDPIFHAFPKEFVGYVAHYQSIFKLPNKAEVFAASDFEPSHGVRFGKNIWGVQFHPEFNAEIACLHLMNQEEELKQRGYPMEELYSGIKEEEYGRIILQRFYWFGEQRIVI